MNPTPPYREATMENHHYPFVATGVILNRSRNTDVELWEGKVRRIMGLLQIILGVTELSLGILVFLLPSDFKDVNCLGWGIWNGVIAIVTGFVGVSKLRTKGQARTYMGTSIITAILCGDCFMYAAIGVLSEQGILYIIMCIVFLLQTAISIIGATFSCSALCSTTDQVHQVMNPPSYSEVVLESQQHPSVSQGLLDNTTRPDGNFWRVNGRRIIGNVQIVIGGIEVALGIAVIFVPDETSTLVNQDYVGWGIWHGVFAILSGSLGVYSARKMWEVIGYAITSIITAVLCAGCVFYAFLKAVVEGEGDTRDLNLPIYIILTIVFLIQMLISVIGATFSCDSMTIQSRQVMNPSSNLEATLESQHTSSETPDCVNDPTRQNDIYWGANIQRVMGVLQIMFGGIECALGIVFIFLSECFFHSTNDYVGWGVSSGVFAMVSGLIGFFSVKKKYMVRTYVMASIINAVLCVDCLAYILIRAVPYGLFESCSSFYLAMHYSLCVVLSIQVIISTIGASFSRAALRFTTNHLQQGVEYTPLLLSQQYDPAPPYVGDASQSVLAYQITTTSADCLSEVPTTESTV
ncbi:hypothetical protein HOLleu_35676 [Holothuria leucospilota]|uniref:Uncharacterized protein n=1 Tax=Holothuria leucospilota TaxID=206669 RepID=A0A9Q1BF92_HOLLE|nr:hypothetical protein HOLleu_35676 [Holothuria leucospilota]